MTVAKQKQSSSTQHNPVMRQQSEQASLQPGTVNASYGACAKSLSIALELFTSAA